MTEPYNMIKEFVEMSEYRQKGLKFSEQVVKDAHEAYQHDPIFHNRVDLSVDVIRTFLGDEVAFTKEQMSVLRSVASVALLLEQDDRAKKESDLDRIVPPPAESS